MLNPCRAHRPLPLAVVVCATTLLVACQAPTAGDAFYGSGVGAKADDATETLIALGEPVSAELSSSNEVDRHALNLESSSTLTIEITRSGSARGLDTRLSVRGADSPDAIQEDDDSGYGQLSKIEELALEPGAYTIAVSVDPEAPELEGPKAYRLLVTAEGAPDEPELEGDLPNDVHWVRNSAEYIATVAQAYRAATLELSRRADAGELPRRWAVALDIDETILSNSLYRKERALGLDTTWPSWVYRKEATALPGASRFIDRVQDLGGTVALVTNRHVSQCRATAENLERVGIDYDVILCQDGTSDKDPRWQSIENGTARDGLEPAEIVMWVGDNIHDFRGMSQDERLAGEEAFADFGTRFIVIPNPMSGSWVRNPMR